MGQGSSLASEGMAKDFAAINKQMDGTVSEFHRLVNLLGTPVDNPELRDQLENRWLQAHELAQQTSTLLSESDQMVRHRRTSQDMEKIEEVKLARDFLATVGRFNEAQLLAAEKQPPYVPRLDIASSSVTDEAGMSTTLNKKDSGVGDVIEGSNRMLKLLQDSENTLREAAAEGEDGEIVQQLQAQIDSLRMVAKDLTQLDDYAFRIDDVPPTAEVAAAASLRAKSRLLRRARRPNSILVCLCRILGLCFSLGS